MKLAIAALRAIVGALFVGHGLQKLTGSFGGHGLDGTAQAFEGLGLKPGKLHATAAGASEAVGGALFAAGLLTPLGASLITGTMGTAIEKVHAKNGPWATNGGYEYNLVLIAAVFAVTATGPGELSLDHLLGTSRSGTGIAIAELAAGLIGSAALVRLTSGSEPETPAAGE